MMPISRRAACCGLLATLPALAGCGDDTPPPSTFAPLDFSFLTKLRLNVASVGIDDSWQPSGPGEHVEYLAPVRPADSLRQMAQQRLVAAGNSGQARFVIEDASIVAGPGRLDGLLAVRLDVSTSDGTRSGYAEAKVVRSITGGPDQSDGGRAAAYDLTKRMMDDMNVELEYQLRRTLREYLLTTSGSAPQPGAVQQQDLAPPPGITLAPPGAPFPSPGS